MGQKVNPVGLRLILNKKWQSKWYANKKDFGDFLQEDIKFLIESFQWRGITDEKQKGELILQKLDE